MGYHDMTADGDSIFECNIYLLHSVRKNMDGLNELVTCLVECVVDSFFRISISVCFEFNEAELVGIEQGTIGYTTRMILKIFVNIEINKIFFQKFLVFIGILLPLFVPKYSNELGYSTLAAALCVPMNKVSGFISISNCFTGPKFLISNLSCLFIFLQNYIFCSK